MSTDNSGGLTVLGLRFDNHVSAGHIFTTITVIIAGIAWFINTENRLENLERQDVVLETRMQEQKQEFKEILSEIKLNLREINSKLDSKVDR